MLLYFLRHATASKGARKDADRKLTSAGRVEAKMAGAALDRLGCKPALILTSPLVRAEQTARLAAEEFRSKIEVKVVDQLKNTAGTEALLSLLRRLGSMDEVVLVGHSPSMLEHIATLIGTDKPANTPLAKGGIACLDLPSVRPGMGQMRWLMRPKHLRLLASS